MSKHRENLDVLLMGEFYGFVDSWTEYLCLARNADRTVTLTSRSREILAEAARYMDEDGFINPPATIHRKPVWGVKGDWVLGERLVPHDGNAELTISQNQFDMAAEWLVRRKWDTQPLFGEAWSRIRSALYGRDFFRAGNQLPSFSPRTSGDWEASRNTATAACANGQYEGAPSSRSSKLREIVIRFPGPPEPWIVWRELVFIEWSKTSYSVYAHTGNALGGWNSRTGLMPPRPRPLSWREVLEFVESNEVAEAPWTADKHIVISGVERWQRDVIIDAMLPWFSAMVQFLSRLSDDELKGLHMQLGGFLSPESRRYLNRLAESDLKTRSKAKLCSGMKGVAQSFIAAHDYSPD